MTHTNWNLLYAHRTTSTRVVLDSLFLNGFQHYILDVFIVKRRITKTKMSFKEPEIELIIEIKRNIQKTLTLK